MTKLNWKQLKASGRGWTFHGRDERGEIVASLSFSYLASGGGNAFSPNMGNSGAHFCAKAHAHGMDDGVEVVDLWVKVRDRNAGDKWARSVARNLRDNWALVVDAQAHVAERRADVRAEDDRVRAVRAARLAAVKAAAQV